MDRVTFFFGGGEPVARILVVGSLAYIALIFILRITGKRTLARMNAFDFIVTVALGASFGRILIARSVAVVEAIAAFALLALLQLTVTTLQIPAVQSRRHRAALPSLLSETIPPRYHAAPADHGGGAQGLMIHPISVAPMRRAVRLVGIAEVCFIPEIGGPGGATNERALDRGS